MSFVQVIDCRTTRYDEMMALDTEWEQAVGGRSTLRRQIVTRFRDDPDHYAVFCFFDSYDSAMENSNLPETAAGAAAYAALMDGPPTFHDLDIIEDRTLDAAAASKPGFLQVIDLRTSRPEEMSSLDQEYEASISDRTTVRRSLVGQDRNTAGRYLIVVLFDSYDSAMTNSNLPETSALAGKMGALVDGPPSFYDLDVLDDRTL